MRKFLLAFVAALAFAGVAYAQNPPLNSGVVGWLQSLYNQLSDGGTGNPRTMVVASGTGSTGATTASIAAAANKSSFLCGFTVSVLENATGGTTSGPYTVTGSQATLVYQQATIAASAATQFSQTYIPCLPSSAVNTAISVATTANADATTVNVSVWGYQR